VHAHGLIAHYPFDRGCIFYRLGIFQKYLVTSYQEPSCTAVFRMVTLGGV